ncbi:tetratricopeptide repeat protein [Telmatospirillum sp.]|uniref:tetratricopeptide repeat protein n=1 Tax=Telmatospirillum sp. TaxID=2079197 RepID=UPI0028443635|nr:tetratricopeptide repeat protein [Telmatospirillum sp.]MDR3435546.1 tetratricopeptide repeat protein [Telmatospirillum sp.]
MLNACQILEQASAHRQAAQLGQAEALCHRALRSQPDNAAGLHLLGNLAHETGRDAEAVGHLARAIALRPTEAGLYRDLGLALRSCGRMDEALASFRRAWRLDPGDIESQMMIGRIASSQGAVADAEAAFHAVLSRDPTHGFAAMNLANLLQEQGRFDEARVWYQETLRHLPDRAEAHKNCAVALAEQGKLDDAEREIRQAIRWQPGDSSLRMALGQILLLGGHLEEGWKQYEWRWRTKDTPSMPRGFQQPLWTGKNGHDQVLLVHAEQGFGDTLQFCRYVSLAAERTRVILEVPRSLVGLLSTIPGIETIVARGDALPSFDYHCPLLSLPRIFGTTLANIPSQIPYLKTDPSRVSQWKIRLESITGFRVGLVWAGGPVTPRNSQRSIDPDALRVLAGIPDVRFISLQKYATSADGLKSPPSCLDLIDWTENIEDFADTAALVAGLDLVISVDTAVAHLAGALGKPVWLLNRFFPCWRWLLGRDTSPWYPSLRQFRQSRLNDWDSVLVRVRSELQQQWQEAW